MTLQQFNGYLVWLVILPFIGSASFTACKKKASSDSKAITSEDGLNSFALIPIRLNLETSLAGDLGQKPVSLSLVQGLRFGVYECTGSNAEQEAMLLEATYESSGEAIRRNGKDIINHMATAATPSSCKLQGTYLAGPKSIAKMITDTPNVASQALFLALRGPTTLNHQTPGARFYSSSR